MKEIKAYKTTDDRIYEHEEQAKQHQAYLDFKEYYEDGNEMFGNIAGSRVVFADLVDWLETHKDLVLNFYKGRR